MRERLSLAFVPLLISCGGATASHQLLQNKGSDSMLVVAVAWAEAYETVAPEVGIAVTGGGSGVGIAGLLNGTVDIANLSRGLLPAEQKLARSLGFDAACRVVGYDSPAVVVHEENPLEEVSLQELAEIYGEGSSLTKWSHLGVEVPGCAGGEIVRVNRTDSSGTYGYVQQRILGPRREYELGSRDMQGSKDVVELVATTPCAIGYAGLAYATPADVKMLCVSGQGEGQCILPSVQSAVDGTYPLARPLLMLPRPDGSREIEAYLRWVFSDEGQCILREIGYAPVRPVSCG